ncbi:MAG TPA: DUF4126 domain-containing protein [Streptosporangiaceae bacterium]|nr:DUF4126 domain-containing protein [Streptosporangiaceae bacterium]
MLPVPLIFSSGVASGVNCYAAVLILGLLGRYGHVASIPAVLERPEVLVAAAILYAGQFIAGKIPIVDSAWDLIHTAIRPVVGGAIGVVMAHHAHVSHGAVFAAAALGGGSALTSHLVKTGIGIGINASPEPVSNVIASLLEDLGVAALVVYAVHHPVQAAVFACALLALGVLLLAFLTARIRRALQRRRAVRHASRAAHPA